MPPYSNMDMGFTAQSDLALSKALYRGEMQSTNQKTFETMDQSCNENLQHPKSNRSLKMPFQHYATSLRKHERGANFIEGINQGQVRRSVNSELDRVMMEPSKRFRPNLNMYGEPQKI